MAFLGQTRETDGFFLHESDYQTCRTGCVCVCVCVCVGGGGGGGGGRKYGFTNEEVIFEKDMHEMGRDFLDGM